MSTRAVIESSLTSRNPAMSAPPRVPSSLARARFLDMSWSNRTTLPTALTDQPILANSKM